MVFSGLKYNPLPFLTRATQPWVAYNTRRHLLQQEENDPSVQQAQAQLRCHPLVVRLLKEAQQWPGYPLPYPNDAPHPLHKIVLLADLGFTVADPGVDRVVNSILAYQAPEGAFLTRVVSGYFGSGPEALAWTLCDAPTLLYALLAFGLVEHPQVRRAVDHLTSQVRAKGWPCLGSHLAVDEFGWGDDQCPYANLLALKALAHDSQRNHSTLCHRGLEAQLAHWANRAGRRIYLFGIGRRFQQLAYPYIWYNIVHVVDVLSRFPSARKDTRFHEMLALINARQQPNGGFIPESVWPPYAAWDFGQTTVASPWLTYQITRINQRCNL